MTQYPAYQKYKPTGCDWFPEIPEHWSIDRAKWSVTACQNGVWGAEPDGDDDLVCIRVADFDRQSLRVSTEKLTMRSITEKDRRNRLLEAGDLLLEKSGGGENQLVGTVVEFNQPFPAVSSNFIARMIASKDVSSRFLVYVHSHLYAGRVNIRSIKQTTGIQNLDSQAYLDEPIVYPPFEEQQTIARFLDFKTAQIDALIAKQQVLLDKLAEKRTALISHAVTKGLDPSAPMKDSGVDWLGDIPAHWISSKLRFLTTKIEQGWSPQCNNQKADLGQWGVLKVGCVNGDSFDDNENKSLPDDLEPRVQYEVKEGDILVSRANTKELLGSAAIVKNSRAKLLLCDKLYRISPNELVDRDYLIRVLRSTAARFQYERNATGTSGSMQNIGQDTLKDLPVPLPPKAEQEEISRFLEKVSAGTALAESRVRDAIGKLKEYRAALITNAVTGKIDVRNYPIQNQTNVKEVTHG
jgi:type I restriction enzyme, S subunit